MRMIRLRPLNQNDEVIWQSRERQGLAVQAEIDNFTIRSAWSLILSPGGFQKLNLVLWGVFAYVGAQLVVGLLVSRKISTEADYLLGGRRFGYGLLVMTIFATWFGAETCIGASGEVYAHGLAGARMDPFGYTICLLLMGLFIAAPLWRKQYTTLADLFRDRFSPGVERLSVILLVPTSVMWAGAQIRAFGSVLSAASEMTLDIAIALSAAVVIIYTARGGMIADACTDFIQGIVLILGLLIISGYIGYEYASGNFTHLDSSRLNLAYAQEESPLAQMESWCIPIIGSLLSQELISRTLAARSPEVARNSALLAGLLYFCVGMIPVFLGLIGPAILPGLEIPEHFLPELAQHYLNPFLFVLFAGALISAILSTVDSALLAAGGLTSHNLIIPLMPGLSEKKKVMISRGSVFFFGLVSYFLAVSADGVHDLVEEASAFGSTGIFIVVFFGLFTRYGGVVSGYATLIVGILVYVSGSYVVQVRYPYLVSLGAALATYLVIGAWEMSREKVILPALDSQPAREET